MKKKYIIFTLCLSLCVAFITPLRAQEAQMVVGTVVSEKGEPIVGATIIIEGSTKGTTSGAKGNFSISVPEGKTLIVSFMGYIPQKITNLTNPKVVLKEDNLNLEKIVVVGYGTQKQRNVTGAIATISPDEIKDLSAGSLGSSLSGLTPGLSVNGGNTRPGSEPRITIRQTDVASSFPSVSGYVPDDEPIYIIDDYVASSSDFNNLNPNDIESISVLKDAAAAVYGVRAAKGAILVKTKRGKNGAPKISYQGQFGLTDEAYRAKMLNSYDYGKLWNGMIAANTTTTTTDTRKDLFQYDELEAMKNINYDLLEKEWRAALTQTHNVNVSGGSENATYFTSLSYYNQDGNMGRINYERWNYRAGVDASINKWFKANLLLSGNNGEKNSALNKIGGSNGETDYNVLLSRPRYIPDYIGDKPIVGYGVSNTQRDAIQNYNFDALQQTKNYSDESPSDMTFNSSLEHNFGWFKPLEGLKMKVTYSKSISTNKSNQMAMDYTLYKVVNRSTGGLGSSLDGHLYSGSDFDYSDSNFLPMQLSSAGSNESYLVRDMSRGQRYQANFLTTYTRTFGRHDLSGLFTIEKAESYTETLNGQVNKPASYTDGQSKSATGTQTTVFGRTESGMLSYVGRINYSYSDKYLFEGVIRSDASTKFAPENYWGTFYSMSAGWIISDESWFKKSENGINFLKLRGSYGMLGDDNTKPWGWLQLYGQENDKGAVFGTSPANPRGYAINSSEAPNRNAHWDKSYKTNLGIDLNAMKGRFSVGLDGYYEMKRDMFASRESTASLPATSGTKPAPENWGSLDLWGVELSLGWKNKVGKFFSYFVKINTGYSDNKLLKYPWKSKIPLNDYHPGDRKDLGEWGLECIGMFRSYQEIEEYFAKYNITTYLGNTKDNVRPGMLIYRDIRGGQNDDGTYNPADGVVDATNDIVRISNRSNPYGFTVNLGGAWKNLSMSAQIGASWGGYSFVPKTARGIQNLISPSGNYRDMEYTNLPSFWANNMFVYQDILDANGNVVASQNLDAKYPNLRYSENMLTSTFWKVSGTNVTLKNITLAYSIPKALAAKIGIGGIRINATAQNVLSFFNPYPDNFISTLSSNYGNYPTLRRYSLGVNVSF